MGRRPLSSRSCVDRRDKQDGQKVEREGARLKPYLLIWGHAELASLVCLQSGGRAGERAGRPASQAKCSRPHGSHHTSMLTPPCNSFSPISPTRQNGRRRGEIYEGTGLHENIVEWRTTARGRFGTPNRALPPVSPCCPIPPSPWVKERKREPVRGGRGREQGM